MATPYLLFLLAIQCTIRSHMRTWKILMEAINYDKFKWQICGDLKVIALLLGL